jgi:4-hydroxy-3-polyprenylbenzoate decarboxylase
MPYKDLREFIDKLESEGELKRVKKEVDWNLEVGAISRRGLDLRGPAYLFENIKDYPKGYRIMANILGPTGPVVHGRLSLALGLPKDTPTIDLISEFRKRIKKRIKPKIVKTAPCKENILVGSEVDLLKFPAPFIHGPDGGRYLGTWHVSVTKDPETGVVNYGMYRHMLHDGNSVGIWALPQKKGNLHFQKHEAMEEDMPIAIAIGTEPAATVIASTILPANEDEEGIVGGLRGEPAELVKCETTDLYVPASSEIVIEGMVKHRERKSEGPFGEWTGYMARVRIPRPFIQVTCVTYRDDPILTMSNMGKPWDEYDVMTTVCYTANLTNELEARGLSFKAVYLPPVQNAIIVSATPIYPGYIHTLASAIWSCQTGVRRPFIFAVGEDVDVTNLEEVFWCLTTRIHPGRNITIENGTPSNAAMPFLNPEERKEYSTASRVLFDATFPFEWSEEETPIIIDLEHAWPAEVRDKVLDNWKEFG